jgi:hypothetical protein
VAQQRLAEPPSAPLSGARSDPNGKGGNPGYPKAPGCGHAECPVVETPSWRLGRTEIGECLPVYRGKLAIDLIGTKLPVRGPRRAFIA